MDNKIIINHINCNEALRYLGYGKNIPDNTTKELLFQCSDNLLKIIDGKYIYKVFNLNIGKVENCTFKLEGKTIQEHLKDCEKVIFMCATLSMQVDDLIRREQITSMAKAAMTDSLASVAIEQICDKAEYIMLKDFPEYEHTWRYGLGYGDFPLNKQKEFLEILDAPKRIGVNCNSSMMLTPTKSVTCVIGLGHNLKVDSKKHCDYCNFRKKCQFRKEGKNCGR